MTIGVTALRKLGDLGEDGTQGAAGRGGAAVPACAAGVDRRCGRAGDPGAAGAVPDMLVMVVAERIGWDRSITVLREGRGAAAAVPSAGPGRADGVRAGRAGAGRFLVPAGGDPLGHGTVAGGR